MMRNPPTGRVEPSSRFLAITRRSFVALSAAQRALDDANARIGATNANAPGPSEDVATTGRTISESTALRKNRARIVALLAALCGYTFVNIEGDHNTVSDTGGHGGRVQMPERSTNANPPQRLI
jgi:hypothetical protein